MNDTRIIIAAVVLALISGCRFTTDMSLLNTSSASTSPAHTPQDIVNKDSVRLRWFPVDTAIGYRIDVESPSGTVLHKEAVEPTGCTHKVRDGHTSGVCTLVYKPPSVEGQYLLRLRALDSEGGASAPSVRLRPIAR